MTHSTPDARSIGPLLSPAGGHRSVFPFTALVGQTGLQRALLLTAIDPGIGGVLISGPRGTAKSTSARALAALLPDAPFVTLPLSASLAQLIGTLDVQAALRDGEVQLQPGLVARAHGGVLYVDEVNLLPDPLVDALLDVAASGVNTVEHDGISRQHGARFVLVGTMNPEEGELRPQLLDRFGLSVALANPDTVAQRQAISRARLAFEMDPAAVQAAHAHQQAQLAASIQAAQCVLPGMVWPEAVFQRAAELALQAGVDGVRADLVMLRAARAWAALEGRTHVAPADVDAVADWALAHRRQAGGASPAPAPAPGPSSSSAPAPAPNSHAAPPSQGRADRGGQAQSATSRPQQGPSDGAPEPGGDWGALPAQPMGMARVRTVGDWLPKKA
jgi:magnesium chelatase subunit I